MYSGWWMMVGDVVITSQRIHSGSTAVCLGVVVTLFENLEYLLEAVIVLWDPRAQTIEEVLVLFECGWTYRS